MLFNQYWPRPFLPDDSIYIDQYNLEINKLAKTLMNFNINHLKDQINKLKTNIQEYKDKLASIENLDDLINIISEEEESKSKNDFMIADEKAKKSVVRPFTTKRNKSNKNHQID